MVYTINEPAAYGAYQALKAAGKEKSTILVSIDGGCTGVGQVKSGIIGATSQQYPSKMAALGMEAIVKLAKTGEKPKTSRRTRLLQHRVAPRHRQTPVSGVTSITPDEATKICWGK